MNLGVRFVNSVLPEMVGKVAAKSGSVLNGNLFSAIGETIYGGGKFGYKVCSQDVVAGLASDAASNTALSAEKVLSLCGLGLGTGLTAYNGCNTIEATRRHFQIQQRSGAYFTDDSSNKKVGIAAAGSAGLGLVAGGQGAAEMASGLIVKNSSGTGISAALGGLCDDVGRGLGFGLKAITGTTGALGNTFAPGFGKFTGSARTLMLAGTAIHTGLNHYYLKMPQNSSSLNSWGWGGKKFNIVTDPTDPFFLQPANREALARRLLKDQEGGLYRSAPWSSVWETLA